jgi:hypothetical protein
MENNAQQIKQLSRTDRIREEAKRALEFGQAPKRPLSLQPNFRVEGLAAAPRPQCAAENAPGEQFLSLSRVQVVSSLSTNPFVAKENPTYLAEQIQHELGRSSGQKQNSKLLDLLSRLTNAAANSQTTETLRRKVLSHVFGERYLQSEQNLPKERGAKAMGNSISLNTGKEA